jgi:hypothetical protein
MQGVGDLGKRLGHVRAGGCDQRDRKDVNPALSNRPQLLGFRVRAKSCQGDPGVRRGEVDVRVESCESIERERFEPWSRAGDASPSGAPDQVAEERLCGHGDEEAGVDKDR